MNCLSIVIELIVVNMIYKAAIYFTDVSIMW